VGAILVLNAGSTSLKLSAVEPDGTTLDVKSLAETPPDLSGVAHRVVHGGSRFREPVQIDDEVMAELVRLTELAPLHMAPAVEALRQARAELPDLPHVAVFDTAFHATIPDVASTYALPRRAREDWGIRRYGFHGLSVQWASEQVPVDRLVVCHLGGGCSVTAVRSGQSVDTTMGLTPLEGVPMATRPGSVDPGALLHLLRHHLSLEELDRMLERESGLLGLSESSSRVEELERSLEPTARLALEVFGYRVAGAVASMAVALEGLDALVFTAGVGEGSTRVRERVCERLRILGVELDPAANRRGGAPAELGKAGSPVRIVIVHAREDMMAARAARSLLAS
jgi:acetate kinase